MTLVLLVLAAVWAAVLIPPALRARQEGRPSDSISNFRRQLAVLRRTGPRSQRMGPLDPWTRPAGPLSPLASVSRLPTGSTVHSGHGLNGFHNGNGLHNGNGRPHHRPTRRHAGHPRPSSSARARTLRRRRDVLTALVAAVLVTLVLGAIPALRVLWALHLVADLLLVAYVALLIHQRNVAAERDLKVRFLPETTRFDPALLPGEPALLRRSAN